MNDKFPKYEIQIEVFIETTSLFLFHITLTVKIFNHKSCDKKQEIDKRKQ